MQRQGREWQGKAEQSRAGARQGRAGQSKAGQGRVGKRVTMQRAMHKAIQDTAHYRIRRKA